MAECLALIDRSQEAGSLDLLSLGITPVRDKEKYRPPATIIGAGRTYIELITQLGPLAKRC